MSYHDHPLRGAPGAYTIHAAGLEIHGMMTRAYAPDGPTLTDRILADARRTARRAGLRHPFSLSLCYAPNRSEWFYAVTPRARRTARPS